MERPGGPECDRCRKRAREPAPALELQGGDHRERQRWDCQHDRNDHARLQWIAPVWCAFSRRIRNRSGGVAKLGNSSNKLGDRGLGRVELDEGALGREVDSCAVNPGQCRQGVLGAKNAGGAVEPLERELDLLSGGVSHNGQSIHTPGGYYTMCLWNTEMPRAATPQPRMSCSSDSLARRVRCVVSRG